MAYKTIDETFWTDPSNQNIPAMDRYLLLYLITNPHTHYSGIYYLPKIFMVEETGLSLQKINSGLKSLPIKYDEKLKVLWVEKMCKHQLRQGNKKNLLTGISNHLKTLHNSLLIKAFLEDYSHLDIEYSNPSEWDGEPMPESVAVEVTEEGTVTEEVGEKITVGDIVDGWNEICATKGFPKVERLSPDRRSKINSRLKINKDVEFWNKVFNKIVQTPFLTGKNDRGWKVTFDWLFSNDENSIKIYEGNYEQERK